METDKEKNQGDSNSPDDDKRKETADLKKSKDTTLAKRSGQRPALPFRRKPPA